MFYTLKVMLPSLTALSKSFQTEAINFPRIAPNVDKTKTKLQQLFNEDKAMELLKEDIKIRLEPCNLVIDQKVEEKINSITERYVKAMLWNIDERFPCNLLNILDAFSIYSIWRTFSPISPQASSVSMVAVMWRF